MATDEELASPRPWTYHNAPSQHGIAGLERDWIEDANGNTILENLGCLDGPLICRAVNLLHTLALQNRVDLTRPYGTPIPTETVVGAMPIND